MLGLFKRKAERPPLMERVRSYVETCKRHGWRPVFTREQFEAIYDGTVNSTAPLSLEALAGNPQFEQLRQLYGVPFTIDDTPRPAMPSEEWKRQNPVTWAMRKLEHHAQH